MNLKFFLSEDKWENIIYYLSTKGYKNVNELSSEIIMDLYFVPGVSFQLISELKERLENENDVENKLSSESLYEKKKIEDQLVKKTNNKLNNILYISKTTKNKYLIKLLNFSWKVAFQREEINGKLENHFNQIRIETIKELIFYLDQFKKNKIPQVSQKKVDTFINEFIKRIDELLRYSSIEEAKENSVLNLNWDVLNSKSNLSYLLLCCLDEISERDYNILLSRALGDTLETIGNREGVTRERVRQITNRHSKIIYKSLIDLTYVLEKDRGYVLLSEIKELFHDDDEHFFIYIWLLKQRSGNYIYLWYAEIFINTETVDQEWEQKFDEMIEENSKKFGDINELYEIISKDLKLNNLNFINNGNLENFLTSISRFTMTHDMYRRPDTEVKDLIEHVINESFEFDVKLDKSKDNQDIMRIKEIVLKQFPEVAFPKSNHAFTALATRNKNIILSGRGRYVNLEKVYFPKYLREQIFDWIDNNPNTTLTYTEVFSENKGRLLSESNISNSNFLHGVLKLYYEEDFKFKRDDFTKIGSDRIKTDDRVHDLLRKNGSMSIHEITKEIPGIQEYQISAIEERSENIFRMSNKKLTLDEKIPLIQSDIELISKIIIKLLSENDYYITSKFLMKFLLNKHPKLVEKSGLSEPGLYQYLRLKLSDSFRFRNPHIVSQNHQLAKSDLSSSTILEYFFIKDKQRFFQSDLEKFSRKYFWAEASIYFFIQELEDRFFRLSSDEYILKGLIKVDDIKINEFDNYLDKLNFDYYSIQNFQVVSDMPQIPIKWNLFLIEEFILKYSKKYRLIDRLKKGRHYVSSVIVPVNSKLETYEDVIINILRVRGEREISEKNLLRILQNNGLCSSIIPLEIWTGDKIKYNHRNNLFEDKAK